MSYFPERGFHWKRNPMFTPSMVDRSIDRVLGQEKKREIIAVPVGQLPSDHNFRHAATLVSFDITEVTKGRLPVNDEDRPSIRNYFMPEVVSVIPQNVIDHVDRYAYASAINEEVRIQLTEQVGYNQDIWTPDMQFKRETRRLARKIKMVKTHPGKHVFAKSDVADNPYLQFIDDLRTSYIAASERFQQVMPDLSAWMISIHDDLVKKDPWSTIPKNKITHERLFTGVEGPFQIGSFLWFLNEDIFPRTGDQVGLGGIDVHKADALEKAEIAAELAFYDTLRRTSFGINEFVKNRPGWKVPQWLMNDPHKPEYDSTQVPIFQIDPSRVTLRLQKIKIKGLEKIANYRYVLETDGQFNHSQPGDPPRVRPLLTCPAQFRESVTLFNGAVINSAYEAGLFGEIGRNPITYPINLNVSELINYF